MPSTGFNRVRQRSRVIQSVSGWSHPPGGDKRYSYYIPYAKTERIKDYVWTKTGADSDRFRSALAKGIDRGGDMELVSIEKWFNSPGHHHRLYYNDVDPWILAEVSGNRGMNITDYPLSVADASPALPDHFGNDPLNLQGYWGPRFFDKANPVKPGASSAQFALELLLGLPAFPLLMFSKLRNFRSLGSEYLNVQFGWLPFVTDVQQMVKALMTADKRLQQLARDSGKGVRRRQDLHSSHEVLDSYHATGYYITEHGTLPQSKEKGSYESQLTKTTRIWGSGRFKYQFEYKALDLSPKILRVLFGAELNPRLLWELIPWSWLIDWFTSVGYNISNWVSNVEDNFVADYAYVMGEIRYETLIRKTGTLGGDNRTGKTSQHTVSPYSRRIDTYRARYSATPYGFGLNPSSFSAKQWAILVALGISRHSPV